MPSDALGTLQSLSGRLNALVEQSAKVAVGNRKLEPPASGMLPARLAAKSILTLSYFGICTEPFWPFKTLKKTSRPSSPANQLTLFGN